MSRAAALNRQTKGYVKISSVLIFHQDCAVPSSSPSLSSSRSCPASLEASLTRAVLDEARHQHLSSGLSESDVSTPDQVDQATSPGAEQDGTTPSATLPSKNGELFCHGNFPVFPWWVVVVDLVVRGRGRRCASVLRIPSL